MNKILETTWFVVENSKNVKINKDRINEFSKRFEHGTTEHWLSQAPFDFSKLTDEQKLNFLFIFNSISFSYWGEPKWTISYEDKNFDGAYGLILALGRAIKENIPILNLDYCSNINKFELTNILRANVEIPLFEERWKILQEIGNVALKKYDGKLKNFVQQANEDAMILLRLITENFPSFRDMSKYKDKEIYFQKRAQLLVYDISKDFDGFKNTDKLTACADYKLPQIMRRFGILEYTNSLAKKIDAKIEIPQNSEEEIEIRANTIWAVEFIKEQAKERNPKITSMGIDDHLWLVSQEKFPDEKPYHRTRTIAY